jgi:predicted HTH domain antitoxin
MSRSLILEIPEDAALTLKVSPEGLGQTLLMAAAAKLYEIGRLSSGAAARLAGVPRTVFLSRLADFGIDTFSLTGEDLDLETRLA